MRRRRQRKSVAPTQNLDSFLDILTNTVGVLMFISLFVTLVTAQAGNIIRTPLLSTSNKTAHFFEVKGDRAAYLDTVSATNQVAQFINSLPFCGEPSFSRDPDSVLYEYYRQQREEYDRCYLERNAQLQNYRATTKYYEVKLYGEGLSLAFLPVEDQPGESPQDLQQTNSDFQQVLKKLNPKNDYLAFIVRPDSFKVFREARKLAWSEGFDVGWEPMPRDRAIIFGTGGRAVGVQ
ncbi:hypothetical protein IQ249_15990 [Lusitaniella coriacea LEGE 07157]|uniref:Uncharacterized protein n=1 Tax=Lusitaniella coriacea LEGE 07157 TaxID=945747 RepID=A0A8J7E131_9CYAN|nr:hypothetical protein [Lusitaniella coriacea]MBE9117401.1 hypothetical protein [Lusitaniella coriacea LEGE 07157]